jgi:hypothetical protein
MGSQNHLAGAPIKLYAALRGVKFSKVDHVRFDLRCAADPTRDLTCAAKVTKHAVKKNEYSGEVTPKAPKDDDLCYALECYLVVPRTQYRRHVGTLVVWHEHIEVTAVEAANGNPAADAHCHVDTDPDQNSRPATNQQGVLLIATRFQEQHNCTWELPWHERQWTKKTGARRTVELDYFFQAKFDGIGPHGTLSQWVLRDAQEGPDCGPQVKLKVKPVTGQGRPGDTVYLRVRVPGKPPLELNAPLSQSLEAEFTFDVGTTAGVSTTVETGSRPTCSDATCTVRHRDFKAKLVFPATPNHDQDIRKPENMGPSCGKILHARVGVTKAQEAKVGDRVHLKVTDANGAVTAHEAQLGAGLDAVFDIDLGTVIGAVHKLEVGSTKECKDDSGSVRNVAYKALLVYPPSGKMDQQQWVNLDHDNTKPEQGHVITVKVVSDTSHGESPANNGDKVYLEAKFDQQNSTRKPDATAPVGHGHGSTYQAETTFANGEASFELNVGHAGGDKVEIKVGCDQTYADDRAGIVTWRKLFYELSYPDTMALVNDDLPAETIAWANSRLADAFIVYEKLSANRYTPGQHLRFPAAYLGRAGNAELVIVGDSDHPGVFASNDKRCIKVTLCDAYFGAAGDVTMRVDSAVHEVVLDVGAVSQNAVLPRNMDTGTTALVEARWTAKPPLAVPNHPGWQHGPAGVAREGVIDAAWVAWPDQGHVKVVFPGNTEPGSFIGPEAQATCPVELMVKVTTADACNGSAGAGAQLLVFKDFAKQCMASTCLHELGHSMGQTVKIAPCTHPKKKTPGVGLPHVVAIGDVYDKHSHTGTHCAFGLTAAQKGQASYGPHRGTCLMFGSGGSADPPGRQSYCAECLKQIKARRLVDLATSWETRGNHLL